MLIASLFEKHVVLLLSKGAFKGLLLRATLFYIALFRNVRCHASAFSLFSSDKSVLFITDSGRKFQFLKYAHISTALRVYPFR